MKRRVVLRADAGKETGYGHFVRSLALARYLEKDFECSFVTFNPNGKYGEPSDLQLQEIVKAQITPLEIIGGDIESFNSDFLEHLYSKDIVVLDNYYFSTEYQAEIKKKGCKLVCVDDVHNRHMVCDLLITVCPLKKDDFSLEPYTEFRGGIEWAFLREPFLTPIPTRNIRSNVRKIVMGMGGADAYSITDKMVDIVSVIFPDSELDIICGETANVKRQESEKIHIHRNISAEKIVSLFDKADLGIFPASTICIEAFSRKLPVIAGYYADNQEELYKFGLEHRFFSGLGCFLDDIPSIMKRLKNIIENDRPRPMVVDFKSQKSQIIELFHRL